MNKPKKLPFRGQKTTNKHFKHEEREIDIRVNI